MRNMSRGVVAAMAVLSLATACSHQRPVGLLQRDGDRAMLQGRPQEAVSYYQEWVSRQPHRPEAHHALGLALLESGRASEAVEPLTVAFDHHPENDSYFDAMADAMRQAGREASLIATLRTSAAERGRLIDYLRLGRNYQALGLMDEAHQAFKTAADIDAGRTVEPQLALAGLFRALNRPREELHRLRMAYSIDPDDPRVIGRLEELNIVVGPSLALPPVERP